MKLGPEEKKIADRMEPGIYSQGGFLGDDPRPPAEIVDTDRSTLQRLELSAETLAEKLGELLDRAVAAEGAPVEVDGLTLKFYDAMGRIPCPFGDGVYRKGEVELTTADGQVLRFTPLSVHMIAGHGFFQGRGSRYRLEPDRLAELLGLGG
jgi:hypothetical protein